MNCGNPRCNHPEENHKTAICNGDLTCFCEKFVQPELEKFAQEVDMFKAKFSDDIKRAKFILEKIPTTRNAGDKSFPKIYKEIWYGIKIRKAGTNLTYDTWKQTPSDDWINRAKRHVKEDNPELRTYNPKVLFEQTALYQAMVEMAIGIE